MYPPAINGWLVRFYNGAMTFVTSDPMTWHPKIICRVRSIHPMHDPKSPILHRPLPVCWDDGESHCE